MESTMLPQITNILQPTGHPVRRTCLFSQADCFVPPLRVLFISTQNSIRSQMAEALLYHLSDGAIEAYSAGTAPATRIHPFARRALEAVGINMHEHYPKHLDRYRRRHFDAIITICDSQHEICPSFPDDPQYIHWSFPDLAGVRGSDEEQYAAFKQLGLQLTKRLRLLMTVLYRKHQQTT